MSECDCVRKVNEALRHHNAVLDLATTINLETGTVRAFIKIATRKASKGSKKAPIVRASFCPFCGVKIEEPKS